MRLAIAVVFLAVLGCSDAKFDSRLVKSETKSDTSVFRESTAIKAVDSSASIVEGTTVHLARAAGSAQGIERKIIYSVNLEIVVKQFDDVQQQVESLVKKYPGAYISEATLSGTQGYRRGGEWTIRVPQDRYENFVAELRAFGGVRLETKKSQEVTEEFYDLSARLKNKKETEKRLLKIQEERTGELEHVITAEREIARVREEIEQMEGRLNRLNDLTSLTTIKLQIDEIQAYQGQELPYADQVRGAWGESVGSLWEGMKEFSLFLVALVPWLPLIVLAVFGMRFLWRRVLRRKPRPAAV